MHEGQNAQVIVDQGPIRILPIHPGWDGRIELTKQSIVGVPLTAKDCGLLPLMLLDYEEGLSQGFFIMLVLDLDLNTLILGNRGECIVEFTEGLLIVGLPFVSDGPIMAETDWHGLLERGQVGEVRVDDLLALFRQCICIADPLKILIMTENDLTILGDPHIALDHIDPTLD